MENDIISRITLAKSEENLSIYSDIKENTRHLEQINNHLIDHRAPIHRKKIQPPWDFTHNVLEKRKSSQKSFVPKDSIRLDSLIGREMMYQYAHHQSGRQFQKRGINASSRDRIYPSLLGNRYKSESNLAKTLSTPFEHYGDGDKLSIPPPPTPEIINDDGKPNDTESLPSVINMSASELPTRSIHMDPTQDIIKHAQQIHDRRLSATLASNTLSSDTQRYMYVFPNRKWANLHDRSATTPGELPKKAKPNRMVRRWASPRSRGSSRHGSLSSHSDHKHLDTLSSSSCDVRSSTASTIKLDLDDMFENSRVPLERADFFCSTISPNSKDVNSLPPINRSANWRLPSPRKQKQINNKMTPRFKPANIAMTVKQ